MNRVLIVDDTPDVRLLIRVALEVADGFDVVDEARDGREAVALAALHQPDIIVIDQMMPSMSGIDAVPLLREAAPDVAIVMFSAVSTTAIADRSVPVESIVGKGDIEGLLRALDGIAARRNAPAASR